MIDINLIVNQKEGVAGFDDWFDADDCEKIAQALKLIGFDVNIEEVDYEFSDYPVLRRRTKGEPIPKTAKNVFLILSNLDKDNDEILNILGIEREKGSFVISTMGRTLQGEYIKWQKIDHKEEWDSEEERLKAFAGYIESKEKISDKGIQKAIKKMTSKGCLRLEDVKFPECKKEFNKNCLECQFGKEFIKTEADIKRFNEVLNNG